MASVTMTVNGKQTSADVDERTLLVQFLRENLRLTGTHVGCDTSQCGACVVHVDGVARKSCTTFAWQVDGAKITTIEGLNDKVSAAVQKAWVDNHVPQCGFCQSGQVMSAAALLATNRRPTDADIDAAMSANLCRCATYVRIRAAIKEAAKALA